ncbi:hypothetical protein PORY_001631 [Pneumocystis oryctolagi]|uniref:Uncharacterized protein n=1 Tax=Pneumocystis oryctolagi TaxID=42067 RepID=A0ACB7CBF9_9ASCO|nr:hypothetical protein PORY_001631 [Pneumocystis oryctolagi]
MSLSSNSAQSLPIKNNRTCMNVISEPDLSSHACCMSKYDEMMCKSAPTVAKFSFGPITHTTVVTTTTTTTTNFPPIVFYPPKKKHDFDSKQYPLYNAPTPSCLKRFCFDIDGKPAYFRESDDPHESLYKFQKDMERLQKNNEVTITITENYEHSLDQKTQFLEKKENNVNFQPNSVFSKPSFQKIHAKPITSHEKQTKIIASENTPRHIEPEVLSSSIKKGDICDVYDSDSLNISNNDHISTKIVSSSDLDKNSPNNNNVTYNHTTSNDSNGFQNRTLIESNLQSQQFLPLPSPSLSPVITTLNYANEPYFPTQKDNLDTFSEIASDENKKGDYEKIDTKENNNTFVLSNQGSSIIRIPEILNIFDNLPPNIQTYLMHHLLRRCNKTTLQIVASVVNPALKRDFLTLLPFELALNILKDLDVKSLCRASQVSKKWKQIVDADEWIWKIRFEIDGFKLRENELDQAASEHWSFQCMNSNNISSSRMLKEIKNIPYTNSNVFSKVKKYGRSQNIQGKKHVLMEHEEAVEKNFEETNEEKYRIFQNQHLFKTLYKKHHIIRKNWMNPNIKPRHISFRGHGRNVVTCLQFDSDKIITGSDDSSINVYDTTTGRLRKRLQGHEGGVWALQYLGNTLVSGSTDRTVRVWDIVKGECTQIFEGHISTVRCLQILPPTNIEIIHNGVKKQINTSLIVTGSRDSTLRIWKLPQPGDAHYRPSPPSSPNDIATENANASVNPYYIRTLIGHTNSVRAISGHNNILISGSYDSTVRVWKISTGECMWRLVGHSQKVYSVVIDPKRNRCVSGSMDWKVKVWSLETGTCLWTLEGFDIFNYYYSILIGVLGHSSLVGLLDLSYDYLVSAAADSTLRIWDPDTGKCIHVLSAHTGAITCFQHDENKVISGSDGLLKMWDVRTGRFVTNILTDLSGVWQVRFDERRCVAAVQRDHVTYIEVLDFGAAADGVPEEERGRRIIVDNTISMDDLAQMNGEMV